MVFHFDHIIHYVEDANKTKEAFQELGLHAVTGGRHENQGTYNTLCHFDLSYIEFLSIEDRALFEKVIKEKRDSSPFATIAHDQFTEGFSRIALRTRGLDTLAVTFTEKGLKVTGPVPLSRKRPDGSVLEWSLLFIEDENSKIPLPFFIDWHQTDDERREELKMHHVISPNDSGVASLSHVTIAVENLDETVARWALLFGLPKGDIYEDEDLNARVQKLHLEGGDLYFASPNGEGPAARVLRERGERPFKVTLEGAPVKEERIIHNGNYQFRQAENGKG
ncbi:VOC family protein [Bacillus sp. H-16]|uniref:VOC family protein n=1 Tax=Alteribacter salitolerans TaxID=2912333 RepID=UPI00196428F6|nr:VOC family protein [Alteribacter salitolerans]MBM7094878.1 VOC family protein [Alteribacter salitolerans]